MKPKNVKNDEVAGFLRGDRAPVAAMHAAVQAVVRSFQFPHGEQDRELVQDALSRIVQNLTAGQFRGEASLKTYAQRVAKYTCLEHLRRQRFDVKMDLESIPSRARWSEPEELLLWTEEHLRNLQAFAALPGESRELLRLIFLEGLSYVEVAQRLGVSEGAIKSRVHRVRLTCREATGRDGAGREGIRHEAAAIAKPAGARRGGPRVSE